MFPCYSEANLCMLMPGETKWLQRTLIKWHNAMKHSLNWSNKSQQTNHLDHHNPFNSINATADPKSVLLKASRAFFLLSGNQEHRDREVVASYFGSGRGQCGTSIAL